MEKFLHSLRAEKLLPQYGFIPLFFRCHQFLDGEVMCQSFRVSGRNKFTCRNHILYKNRTTKYMKIYIYWIYSVRCTPDWHTENKSISYVLWILVVGFVFPASITVITSFVTCFQIYRVSFKVFPCAGHLLLYFMLYIVYTNASVYWLFYSYAYSSHLMNCAAHRSKETKKLFN